MDKASRKPLVPLGIDDFDETWDQGRSDFNLDEDLTIDLSEITYVKHESLIFLLGLLMKREREHKQTFLTLPTENRVVQWMRAWQFPEAIFDVTGRRFESLLTPGSRDQFAALGVAPSKYVEVNQTLRGGWESLLPKSFFALTRLNLGWSPKRAAWAALSDTWRDDHIREVLNRYLPYDCHYIANDAVYEAVLNAARHGEATTGYISSQLLPHFSGPQEGEPRRLEIAVWDSGMTFVETLRASLERGDGITSDAYPERGVLVETTVRVEGSAPQRMRIRSDDAVPNTSHYGLLISAFLLGVTSRPDEIDEGEIGGPAGSGLYRVRSTIVDDFGGSLKYISGRDRAQISGSGKENLYRATISRGTAQTPYLPGNLLILSVPMEARA